MTTLVFAVGMVIAVTFSGSLSATGKLQHIIRGQPISFPGVQVVNVEVALVAVDAGVLSVVSSEHLGWLLMLLVAALVIGANEVCNPDARKPGNAVSGMPILDVDHAKAVVVIKRSMNTGYAGIPNPMFTDPKTGMFFADAKAALSEIIVATKSYVTA